MKHTIEVEVPDGCEPTGGHCTSSLRLRNELEVFVPLQPVWQYPEWLGGAGVAMDDRGRWLVYSGVPAQSDRYFAIPDFGWCNSLSPDLFPLWSPPPCTDWRESWHPNPRWEG